MSHPKGHRLITQEAINELQESCIKHWSRGVQYSRESTKFPSVVVQRDILDTVTLGHWGNYGQSHHFMRRFDGQSPLQAYNANVKWVYSNAVSATENLVQRQRYLGSPAALGRGVASYGAKTRRAIPTTQDINILFRGFPKTKYGAKQDSLNWQFLGNAIHAVRE